MYLSDDQSKRFWSKISILSPGECWNWNACKVKGYGNLKVNGKKEKSHRLSWKLTFGEIPAGLLVCHKCDNRSCCNPYHLFLGTIQDNNLDMVSKGRQRGAVGENNASAKMDREKVLRMRNLYAEGIKIYKLGEMFGISKSAASYIVRGETWK